MTKNHTILDQIGVSTAPSGHPILNQLVEAALDAGAIGAKLSGAGWGGNMIALAKANETKKVAEALQKAGARRIIKTVVK